MGGAISATPVLFLKTVTIIFDNCSVYYISAEGVILALSCSDCNISYNYLDFLNLS